ncbi:MAG: alpha/beta hydrolase, partial [Acidiferrobacterales bacterium]
GIRTVRFNFRGVGGSAGSFDNGNGETADLAAVVVWAQNRCPDAETWLAGFSFGAYVALRAAAQRPVSRVVLVAPPVNLYDFGALPSPGHKAIVVQGDQDEVVPVRGVQDWVAGLDAPPQLLIVPDAGHFFHGRLNDLRTSLEGALAPDRGRNAAG